MCGRTGLSLNKDQLQCACSYKPKGSDTYVKPEWLPEHNNGKEYVPSYNIAPTDITPVLVSSSKYRDDAKTDRALKPMMWGIIPPWHKIDDQQTWNNYYDEVDGWIGVRLLHMAGLYSVWRNDDVVMYSYSVITMESNNTMDWLHHRMPAILNSQEQIEAWLDIDNVPAEMALTYLKPVSVLSWHPVSSLVNNSRNKSMDCNKRISETKSKNLQKTLNAWFTPVQKRKSNDDPNTEVKKTKHS